VNNSLLRPTAPLVYRADPVAEGLCGTGPDAGPASLRAEYNLRTDVGDAGSARRYKSVVARRCSAPARHQPPICPLDARKSIEVRSRGVMNALLAIV